MILSRKKKYLQIALNSNLNDAYAIIRQLPPSDRILIEAGTPLIKKYGMDAVAQLHGWWASQLQGTDFLPYIVADMKTMDRADREVGDAFAAGASAVVALGSAPIETLNSFVRECEKVGMDSMVDVMGVKEPIKILRTIPKQPDVVILHRGVDEEKFNKDKPIPYVQIHKIRSAYPTMISIAGGDSIREVQRAVFNDAQIVVVWKEFYEATQVVGKLAEDFLKAIK